MNKEKENRSTLFREGVNHFDHQQEEKQRRQQQQGPPFETTTVLLGNSEFYDEYKCKEDEINAIPSIGITQPSIVKLNFQYFLYELPTFTDEGDDDIVHRSVKSIESYLTEELAKETLQCKFMEENDNLLSRVKYPFHVSKVSPIPLDQIFSECPSDKQRENTNCYVISAGFTPSIFYITDENAIAQAITQQHNGDGGYLRRYHRSLGDSQTTQELYRSYGPILDKLLGGVSDLKPDDNLEAEFHGFVVDPLSSAAFGDQDNFNNNRGDGTTLSTSALSYGNNQNPNPPRAGFFLGIFMICMSAISLAVFVIALSRRRQSNQVIVRVGPPQKVYNDDESCEMSTCDDDDHEIDTNLRA